MNAQGVMHQSGCHLTTKRLQSMITEECERQLARKRHPHADIEKALKHAEAHGWRIEPAGGCSHAWGKMYCPNLDLECRCGEFCITSVWGTPRNPENHAKQIRRVVGGCTEHPLDDESGTEATEQ